MFQGRAIDERASGWIKIIPVLQKRRNSFDHGRHAILSELRDQQAGSATLRIIEGEWSAVLIAIDRACLPSTDESAYKPVAVEELLVMTERQVINNGK